MTNLDALKVLARGRTEEDDDGRIATFRDMLRCFTAYQIRLAGMLRGSILVTNAHHPNYDVWYICDNGGEINVGKVNDMASMRSVPYTATGRKLDGATMAYRVRCVLNGEPIDYDLSMAADLDTLASMNGGGA